MIGARVLAATTAAALLVSAGAAAGAAAHRTTRLPHPIVGAWTRFVTADDWARVGIATEVPAHVSMLVSADGSVVIAESTAVRFAPLTGSRMAITGFYGCGKRKGIYRWRVSAHRLTLTKLQDGCNYADAVFSGIWKFEKT
jgi:hypothetical protein